MHRVLCTGYRIGHASAKVPKFSDSNQNLTRRYHQKIYILAVYVVPADLIMSPFILLQRLLPQHLLSRWVGRLAELKHPKWLKNTLIKAFIKHYQVNMEEAFAPYPEAYVNFNEFFTRALKPGARPLAVADVLSPADGAFSQVGKINDDQIFQAKGKSFTTTSLLGGNEEWAALFQDGDFATVYLSPKDYHRIHMPIQGTLLATRYIPGDLYSVNQTTAENVDGLFARNERLVCLFDTEAGPMAAVLVGAMIVAGIETVWEGQVAPPGSQIITRHYAQPAPAIELKQGDELGRFKLGSTVILLFGKDQIAWETWCHAGNDIRMGECIASRINA